MDYTIRTAVSSDEQAIRNLFLEMLETIYPSKEPQGYEEGYLDRFFSGNGDRIFVADDGGIIAFLSVELHREEKDYIYLDDLSVTASRRNSGIGTQLMLAAESYAGELGVPAVLLHADKSNTSAIRFYERLGYSVLRDDGTRYLLYKDFPGEG